MPVHRISQYEAMQANPENRYLFESQRCLPFTPRRVQQIVQDYRDRAGIAQHVPPTASDTRC
jgi:integrase/recombinase XerD